MKKTWKKVLAGLLVGMMLVTMTACGTKAPESTPEPEDNGEVVVTDMIGREVTIVPGSYTRVVCIGAGALRMYSYVGDVNLLCGVEDIDNETLAERPKMFDAAARPYVMAYGDVFAELPSCGVGGPNGQAAEAEKILACEPDIVISEYEDVEKEDALQEQLGVPVITLKSGFTGVFGNEFLNSMELLGQVFDEGERAKEIVNYVTAETQELMKRTQDIAEEDKPAVYISGLGNWGTTNHLYTAETYSTFAVINVKNAVQGLGTKGVFQLEEEAFETLGPDMDVMIIDAAAIKNIKPMYKEDKNLFNSCKAWQEGEVYLEMPYNAYYTNYEIALANAWFIGKAVYPEQFADIDMTEKMNEITNVFVGKELAEEIFNCPVGAGGYQKIDTATFFQ